MSNNKFDATFHGKPVGHDPEAMNKLPSVQALQSKLPVTPADEKELSALSNKGVKVETKMISLILEDRSGRRKYEKMIKKGWHLAQPPISNSMRRSKLCMFTRVVEK